MAIEVSIVIPAYNHGTYVGHAIRSALNQTIADIEIISIDDASSDETVSVLESFDDQRITIYRHENNLGSAITINEGISLSRGSYVAILNSDDRFHPERLESCLAVMRDQDLRVIGTDVALIDSLGVTIKETSINWIGWHAGLKRLLQESGDLVTTMIAGNIFVSTSNLVVEKSVFDAVGPLFDYRYVQDYDFILRCLQKLQGQVFWLEKKLLQYRLHGTNTISEDKIAPVRQTIELLARQAPRLIRGEFEDRRQVAFEEHIQRLSGYLEYDARHSA